MNKEKLFEAMKQFDEQTLAVAFSYAFNLTFYGVDVTEKWNTATEQSINLHAAYIRGYEDAMEGRKKNEVL